MFKLTLQDIALGWFETESPTWLTEDQMKQEFLKGLILGATLDANSRMLGINSSLI